VGQGVPIARLLQGRTGVEAFPGSGQPLRIPSDAFLASFSPQGSQLAPVFDPHTDPTATHEATLFGSADAPETVLRIARLSPSGQACAGGANDGMPCTSAADCPGSSCGAASPLFDFDTRFASNVGPVVVPRFGPGVCQDTGQSCTDDTA